MAKLEIDVNKLEMAASRLRSIAHPMRIAIIDLLGNNAKLNVTEIYTKLKIEQAAASHHLNILKSKLFKKEIKSISFKIQIHLK